MFLINKSISIKHYYHFVERLSILCGYGLTHHQYKGIALDLNKAESKEELQVKSLSDSYLYILNNINQSFDDVIINNSYYLLTHEIIGDNDLKKIKENYYIHLNAPIEQRVILIHRLINKLQINRKVEFSFIISNYFLLKNNEYPLVPIQGLHQDYLINLKIDDYDRWLMLFDSFKDKIKVSDVIPPSKEEIINLLKDKLSYIKESFHISFLALYGGVSKDIRNEGSDIDFLVKFNDDLLDIEINENKNQLKDYLANIFNSDVDLISFEHALNDLPISGMEDIVVLIR